MQRGLKFLVNYARHPLMVSAVAPSSRFLISRVLKLIPGDAKSFVEFGPGDGALTIPLLRHLSDESKLIAIEKNSEFIGKLEAISSRDNRLSVVNGDALDVCTYCNGKKQDVLISSMPFSQFSDKNRREILENIAKMTRDDGRFIIYQQYTKILFDYLPEYFGKVERSFEWLNIFPSYVFLCKNPRISS